MKKFFIVICVILLSAGITIGADNKDEDRILVGDRIPNYTEEDQPLLDENGEPIILNEEKDGEELTPIERSIIKRDLIKSNQVK